jgi:hypothetical protein
MTLELDSPCGRYLTYRDLIECGETWRRAAHLGTPIDNHPVQQESWDALVALCETLLDPVIDEFGSISLTYCLAGASLSRRVTNEIGRIAPSRDQHASFELNRNNQRICERGGAATDFKVPGTSSLEVAKWIVSNTDFDRLYYYGPENPIHISSNTDPLGQVVILKTSTAGRRIPRVVTANEFVVRT